MDITDVNVERIVFYVSNVAESKQTPLGNESKFLGIAFICHRCNIKLAIQWATKQ